MKKLIPIALALVALLGGAAAGHFLRPAAPPAAENTGHETAEMGHDEGKAAEAEHGSASSDSHRAQHDGHGVDHSGESEFVKLNNQFIVPIIKNGRMVAMVLMSLSLEVSSGAKEAVYAVEPKLRDVYLRVMFDHANAGGFDGAYTARDKLATLRATLAEVSRPLLNDKVRAVLIEEIVRQDSR